VRVISKLSSRLKKRLNPQIMIRPLLFFTFASSLALAAPFGQQLSETGIKHSFLITGTKTVIFDKKGKPVWIASSENVKDRFADPCGGHFLDNGNIVICSYGSPKDSMPDLFELTPDKKVVWEFKAPKFRGSHEVHILTTNGKPVVGKR